MDQRYWLERVQKVEDFYAPRPRNGDTFDRVFGTGSSPSSRRPSLERAPSADRVRATSVDRCDSRAGRIAIPEHNPAGLGRGDRRARSAERTSTEVSVIASKLPEQDLHRFVQKRHFEQHSSESIPLAEKNSSAYRRQRTSSPGTERHSRVVRSSSVPSVGLKSARDSKEYSCLVHAGYEANGDAYAPFMQQTFSRPQKRAPEHGHSARDHGSRAKSALDHQGPASIYIPGKRQFFGADGASNVPHKNLQDSLAPNLTPGRETSEYKQRLALHNARRRHSSRSSAQEPRSVLGRSDALVEKLMGDRHNTRAGLTPAGTGRGNVPPIGARCGDSAAAPCSARRGSTGGFATSRLWRP